MRGSNHSTESVTSAPATMPIAAASGGRTKTHAALLAASPPIHPFAVSETSGLPKRTPVITAAIKAEAAAHSVVLIATSTASPARRR